MADHPLFTRLLASGHDVSDASITIAVGTDDQKVARLDMRYETAAAVCGAISAAVSALAEELPEDRRCSAELIRAQSIYLSQADDGSPMVVLELANGAPISFVLGKQALKDFAAEAFLLSSTPPTQPN